MFFVFDVFHAGFHEWPDLFWFKPAINKGAESITKEVHSPSVGMKFVIFFEQSASLRVHDMLFQCDHAVSPAKLKEFVHHLEQVLVILLIVRGAFQRVQHTGDNLLKNRSGCHDNGTAEEHAKNGDNFSCMKKKPHAPACHVKPGQASPNDDNKTYNYDHAIFFLNAFCTCCFNPPDKAAQRQDGLCVDLADARFGDFHDFRNIPKP